jgi:hypothetical protein
LVIISSKVSAGIAIIVIVLIFPWTCPNTQAQTDITFKPADKFSIPSYNGTISFAVNGTYSKATFENETWTFTNLCLNGSQPLENFTISAQNCNVTIFSYQTFNSTTFQGAMLRYEVEGKGNQILNLGLGPQQGGFSASVQWSVILSNNAFATEGQDWSISHDGTMVVNGATSNITIVHWGFSESSVPNSNLPFYEQHSVAIIIAVAVAATVIVAVAVKVTNRKHSGESELVKNA